MFSAKKFTLAITALLLALAVAPVQAADLSVQEEGSLLPIQQLVGSWSGGTDLGSTFLLSFEDSETYTVTFSLPGVGAGHGHGAWIRTGFNTFALTDVTMILDPNDGSVALIQTTQANVRVFGNKADFELVIHLALPDGTPVDSLRANATADRIPVKLIQ